MFELVVITCRWLQMTGAMILFGSSLFFIYALPTTGAGSAVVLRWPRPLLLRSAMAVLIATLLGFLAQTIVLAGSVQDALQTDALGAATGMSFGRSSIVRFAVSLLFVIAFASTRPGRRAWGLSAASGGVICATFAWMGHGAATSGAAGPLHMASDVLHTLAAGVWVGALIVFLILLSIDGRRPPEARVTLHAALKGFSGIGSAIVAVLVVTGLINGAFVVGLAQVPSMLTTSYGQLLTLKLVLFLGMMFLAAANRFHLTPRLGLALKHDASPGAAVAALRRSLVWETSIAIAVVALVAWLGTLAPPSAG